MVVDKQEMLIVFTPEISNETSIVSQSIICTACTLYRVGRYKCNRMFK